MHQAMQMRNPALAKVLSCIQQKNSRPAGQEKTKWADAVSFVIDKVTKQANAAMISAPNIPIMGAIEKSLLESNEQMKIIARQQASIANHQVMPQVP